MRLRCPKFWLGLVCSAAGLMLAGCNLSQFGAPSTGSSVLPAISGTVHGGQQPISGASIQIYAANTTVGKGASTALLGSPVVTNANGGFSIGAGAYTCPTPGTLVYLTAYGGNPGLPGNVNNTAIGLMVVLGTCSSLSTDAYVTVNELTTVAAVEALAPFMADAAHVGSDAGNPGGLAGAFATAASMVNFATGQLQAAAAGVTQPTALLNTLADILAACVNSAGRSLNHSAPCEVLRSYAGLGGATDTLTAMLLIVRYPSQSVAQLFALVGAAVPFAPTLTTAPTDFTSATSFQMTSAGGDEGFLLAIDTAQHIWVYTYANLYDPATGADDLIYGEKIAIFDSNGSLVTTIPLTANTTAYPLRLAADPFGNMWTINADSTLTKYSGNGAVLSPIGGFKFPISMSPPAGSTEPSPGDAGDYLSTDPSGNLWIAGNGSASSCYFKVNNSGQLITPAGDFCSKAGGTLIDVATDGSGNAWFYGTASVSKVNGAGAYLNSGLNTNGCFYFDPAAQVPPQNGFNVAAENLTYQIIYDRVQDQLWGIALTGLGTIRADGTQVFCETNGLNLPVVPGYETKDGNGGSTFGFQYNVAATTDGAGNLWFITYGGRVVTSGKIQIQAKYYRGLNEVSSNGNLLTPFNASQSLFGLQALSGKTEGIGIDGYGNIWTVNASDVTLTKISGLAAPKNYQ